MSRIFCKNHSYMYQLAAGSGKNEFTVSVPNGKYDVKVEYSDAGMEKGFWITILWKVPPKTSIVNDL